MLTISQGEARKRVSNRVIITDAGASTPCWISTRATQPNGYTKMGIRGMTLLTHRVAYEAFVGPIPDGLQLDHLCKVRACCNPEHLEPVSCRVNLLRGDTITADQVTRTHCPAGHEYVESNTYRRRDRDRSRECLTCRRERSRARRLLTAA